MLSTLPLCQVLLNRPFWVSTGTQRFSPDRKRQKVQYSPFWLRMLMSTDRCAQPCPYRTSEPPPPPCRLGFNLTCTRAPCMGHSQPITGSPPLCGCGTERGLLPHFPQIPSASRSPPARPNFCRARPRLGRRRPTFGGIPRQFRPNSVEQILGSFHRIGRNWAGLGQPWPSSTRLGANSATIGPTSTKVLSASTWICNKWLGIDQDWPASTGIGQILARHPPSLADFNRMGLLSSNSGYLRPK